MAESKATEFVARLRSAANEIEHLAADAANERAEREHWQAEAKRLERLAATRNVNIAVIAEERDRLVDILQALCDEQNGPPLETRREQWQRAFDQARAYLRRASPMDVSGGTSAPDCAHGGATTGVNHDPTDDGKCWIKGCQQPKGHAGFCDPIPGSDVGVGK